MSKHVSRQAVSHSPLPADCGLACDPAGGRTGLWAELGK